MARARENDSGPEGSTAQNAPPPLWPEIEAGIPCLLKLDTKDEFRINKMRTMQRRMKASPCHLENEAPVKDVIRWSERHRRSGRGKHESLLDSLAAGARWFPLDLLSRNALEGRVPEGVDLSSMPRSKRARTNSFEEKRIRALEDRETKAPSKQEEPQPEDVATELPPEEEGDEFDQDYTKDYYDSAGEGDSGGDSGNDEPFF